MSSGVKTEVGAGWNDSEGDLGWGWVAVVECLAGEVKVGRKMMDEVERGRAKRGWTCLETGSRAALRRIDTDMVSRELVRIMGKREKKRRAIYMGMHCFVDSWKMWMMFSNKLGVLEIALDRRR